MRDGLEILAASALATAAAFLLVPLPDQLGGVEAAGSGGEEQVSVAASSASVAAMVEAWERPPDVVETPTEVAPPEMPSPPDAPSMAAMEPPAPSNLPGILPQAQPERPPEPETDSAPPEPPAPRNAPEVSPRPPERPEPQVAEAPEPAPAPAQDSAARAEQTARGSNGGANQGNAQPQQAPSASPQQRQSAMSQWGGQIQARIARRAPRGAGSGTAVVAISVSSSGALQGASIARSSGNPNIDRLALQAVRSAGQFPPAPSALGGGTFSFSVPIRSR